jgi:hypothetical protein
VSTINNDENSVGNISMVSVNGRTFYQGPIFDGRGNRLA